jgi:phosphoribosylformylglycinamidine (FGAM) synthase-like enzyme
VNKSRLLIALAILIGLGAALVTTMRSRESKHSLEKPTASLPTIKKEDVTELAIQRPNEAQVVLKKQGDKWAMTAPFNAEASKDAVDGMLDKLADLKVAGVAATRKENYEKLEVDAAHALRVQVKGGDKLLANLNLGAGRGGNTMVRVEGEEQVLSAKGSLRYAFDKDLKDFRNREITDLQASELTAIALTSGKGTFKFERAPTEGAAWTQVLGKAERPIPKFDPAQVETLANTAAHLRAADFARATDPDSVTGLAVPETKIALTKKDGSKIDISIGKQHTAGEDYYTKVAGNEVVFRLAKFSAERLMPDAKFFEKSDKPATPPSADPHGGMPMGMGGPGGGGGLPPEVMKQLQQQMQAQGAH